MATKRIVSDEEMRAALADKNNMKIINKVIGKYKKLKDKETIRQLQYITLWRALSYYDAKFNQKFTTSLWRFAEWECKRELAKIYNRQNQVKMVSLDKIEGSSSFSYDGDAEYGILLEECLQSIPSQYREIIGEVVVNGRTPQELSVLYNVSAEAIRQKIAKGRKYIKEFLEIN